jgi:hypothetical protein
MPEAGNMAWTLNSIRIFVQESKSDGSQIIPRLQPLNGGTILQFFGYEDQVRLLSALVVGDTDRDSLLGLYSTGNSYTLVTPEGTEGDFFVKKVSYVRIPNSCQTVRTDLASDSPMYNFNIELYPDI